MIRWKKMKRNFEETPRERKKPKKKGMWKTGGLIAAFFASVIVFFVMLETQKEILSAYEVGVVYMAAREIPKGTVVTAKNWTDYFEEASLDKNCIPESAIVAGWLPEDMAAVYSIEEGTILTQGMFEKTLMITKEMDAPCILGFKAEDLYQVVGGVLRAGDRIHIYSVTEEENSNFVWSDVYVEGVFDQSGNRIASGDGSSCAARINIYLDESDVEQFYEELAKGSLRVVKKVA